VPLTGSTVYSWYMESYQTTGFIAHGINDPGTPNRFRRAVGGLEPDMKLIQTIHKKLEELDASRTS
jgi:hypothetical protein